MNGCLVSVIASLIFILQQIKMLQHDKKSAKPREMIFSTEVQEIK
jgi:hypothetical protein